MTPKLLSLVVAVWAVVAASGAGQSDPEQALARRVVREWGGRVEPDDGRPIVAVDLRFSQVATDADLEQLHGFAKLESVHLLNAN